MHHFASIDPLDGQVVGTDAIFSSPNVVPPHGEKKDGTPSLLVPPKDDGIPAPSIYYDVRGEIHNVMVNGGYRINILHTRAGCLRSGDVHPNEQCDFVFKGEVRVWTLEGDGSTMVTTYGKRSFIRIPRGVPHVFEFVEDTIMAEWWEPQGFRAWFYGPYRDIVNRSIDGEGDVGDGEGEGKGGKKGLVVLIPRNHCIRTTVTLVVVVGIVGFALGSRFGGRR